MAAVKRAPAAGFSIIEVAVALFLLALLFGSIFIPLQTQVDTRNVAMTEGLLAHAREALLGYAVARGYFPCPADDASGGHEPAGTDHGTGTCPAYHGLLPAAALGFQPSDGQGYASDAWGSARNRIRYAVTDQTVGPAANTHAFTRVNGMRTAGVATLGDPALSLMHVCASAKGNVLGTGCGSAQTIVSTTPIVIWSVGPNAATGGASPDEAQNPNPRGGSRDRIFVMRVRSSEVGTEFDDIITWIPMPHIVRAMLAAGHIP